MKIKYIAIPALAVLSSCSWTQRQSSNFMDWADRTMPTYDDMNKNSSKVATPAYPADVHMTPAQASSATLGGNSRPGMTAAPAASPVYSQPFHSSSAQPYLATAPASGFAASNTGRRIPAGMLPPSAIQPVPYGQNQSAPTRTDDFPAEYKNAGKSGMDSNMDSMIPPPPI